MRLTQLVFLVAGILPLPLAAQQPVAAGSATAPVGSIVAVVGDSAITNIALAEAVIQRFAAERRQPELEGPEFERIRAEVLESEITELLLLHAAARDTTIKLDDERVREGVEEQLAERQREVGGVARFDSLLQRNGTNLSEYREYLAVELRKSELIGQYVNTVRRNRQPPPVGEQKLRAYFEENRERLVTQWGPKPPLVTIDQIALQIPASDTAIAAARQRADSVFQLLRNGEDFIELAKRFTEEPGGRERGGDLGWIQESGVVRDFARVAFATPPGAYSLPFQSPFGWHILKVERRRSAEAQVRHILFMPTITDADLERALQRGDSIAGLLRAGSEFTPLARQFSDPEFPATRFGPYEPERHQQDFGMDVSTAEAGTVIGPQPYGDGPNRRLLIARVVERTPAGNWSLEDQQVREFLERAIAEEGLMGEIVQELRRSTYVKVFEQ